MRVRVPAVSSAALALAAALLLAGCASSTSGKPSAAAPSGFPASSASGAAGSGAAGTGRSGPQLIAETITVLKSATAFHAVANGKDSNGSAVALDVHFGQNSSAGSVSEGGFTIQVIVLAGGTAYFKGDDTFWAKLIPAAQQATALPLLRGKWVTGPKSNPDFKQLAASFSKSSLLDSIQQGDPPSDYSVIGVGTRAGKAVVRLRDSTDGSEVDVLASGAPFPVYSETPFSTSGGGGEIAFSAWNAPFTATPPPPGQIFDVSPYLH